MGFLFWTGNALSITPIGLLGGLVLALSLWALALLSGKSASARSASSRAFAVSSHDGDEGAHGGGIAAHFVGDQSLII